MREKRVWGQTLQRNVFVAILISSGQQQLRHTEFKDGFPFIFSLMFMVSLPETVILSSQIAFATNHLCSSFTLAFFLVGLRPFLSLRIFELWSEPGQLLVVFAAPHWLHIYNVQT